MTGRLTNAAAALAAILLAAGSCPAGEHRYLLAGSDSAVWLVRVDDDAKTFDIALREKGGAWKWIEQKLTGRPDQAVASTRKLHLLFLSPLEEVVFQESGAGAHALAPQDPLWPAGEAPLAMCQWHDAESGQIVGLGAVVPRTPGPTTASAPSTAGSPLGGPRPVSAPLGGPSPATATASAPLGGPRPATEMPELRARPGGPSARGERTVVLGVFRRLGANWTHLADLPDVTISDSSRILAATAEGRLYLMIAEPGRGPNRMIVWADGQWRAVPLTGAVAEDAPLAMATVARRIVLALAGSADQAGSQGVKLAEMSDDEAFTVQSLLVGEEPFTFKVGTLLHVARMADQLALLWQDANGLVFGTCQPRLAQLVRDGAVDIFAHAPEGDAAQQLLATITRILLVGLFAITLLYRPRGAAEPFVLPAGTVPGNIGKRLLAMLIDLLPCSLLTSLAGQAWLIGAKGMTQAQVADMFQRAARAIQNDTQADFPLDVAILGIAAMAVFVVYGLVMEARYGATLGKMIFRLRVVGSGGRRVGLRQCVIRNLMKIIELSVTPMLIMLIFVSAVMFITRYNQRFGDLLARTAVIDAASLTPGQTDSADNRPASPDSSPAPPPTTTDKDDESDRGDGRR